MALNFPQIDPVIVQIGPLALRWYAMAYLAGLLLGWQYVKRMARRPPHAATDPQVDDFLTWAVFGVVLGGRLGYVLFYKPAFFLENPGQILAVWNGGMSFHGGLIGGIFAGWLFGYRRNLPFWVIADSTIVTAPVGLFFGRIGNFINGELWGRTTDVPWAMIFPQAGPVPRHPSQLYEALMEGLILFILLWTLRQRPFRDGMMVVFFVLFYGLFRFFLEFFREPDAQLGFVTGVFTMGQILCFAMILGAACLGLYLRKTQPVPEP